MLRNYDFVWSAGVIEHFEDTVGGLSSFVKFLKPGGLLLTMVPNMAGSIGILLSRLNKKVFDTHVVLNREELHRAHQSAGLQVIECDYFMSTNFGVCLAFDGIVPSSLEHRIKKSLVLALVGISLLVWKVEDLLKARVPANPLTSPYIICAAQLDSSASRSNSAPLCETYP
jgi:hypothetical protein